MTTITIKDGKNISRTQFEDINDLLAHFMGKIGFGVLLPLRKEEITQERKKRFEKALKASKSNLLNI